MAKEKPDMGECRTVVLNILLEKSTSEAQNIPDPRNIKIKTLALSYFS